MTNEDLLKNLWALNSATPGGHPKAMELVNQLERFSPGTPLAKDATVEAALGKKAAMVEGKIVLS